MKFYEYLAEKGLLHILQGPPERIDEVRSIFRKENRKQYLKEYQKKRVHRVIIFSKEEFALLKQASKNHALPFATFIRESALKYVSRGFIVPDKDELKKILVLLKKYGVLLNQITYVVNSQKFASPESLKNVLENFDALENEIRGIIESPMIIEDFIADLIEKEPSYHSRIQTLLNSTK